MEDLDIAEENSGSKDKILNTRVSEAIKKAMVLRTDLRSKVEKAPRIKTKNELTKHEKGKWGQLYSAAFERQSNGHLGIAGGLRNWRQSTGNYLEH